MGKADIKRHERGKKHVERKQLQEENLKSAGALDAFLEKHNTPTALSQQVL